MRKYIVGWSYGVLTAAIVNALSRNEPALAVGAMAVMLMPFAWIGIRRAAHIWARGVVNS